MCIHFTGGSCNEGNKCSFSQFDHSAAAQESTPTKPKTKPKDEFRVGLTFAKARSDLTRKVLKGSLSFCLFVFFVLRRALSILEKDYALRVAAPLVVHSTFSDPIILHDALARIPQSMNQPN